jgi:hypothetical protein
VSEEVGSMEKEEKAKGRRQKLANGRTEIVR